MSKPIGGATPRAPSPQQKPAEKPAAPAPAAAKPAQAEAKPQAKAPGFGVGDFFEKVQSGLKSKMLPELSAERRQALERVRGMLEPDKLGGADRTFNFADKSAVTQALMRDTPGLSQEVSDRLRGEGHPLQARIAERALEGRRGPLKAMARNRVYSEAPGQIAGQLDQGLRGAGVDPATGATQDPTRRNLSFAELHAFQQDTAVLEQMRRESKQRTGLDVLFPNGPSQEGIDFILSGRLGIPPGGVLKR